MAEYTSTGYNGRYLKLTITETVNAAANQSTLKWTLQAYGGAVNYYTTGPTTVKINGQQVYYKARVNWNSQIFPAAKGSVSGSLVVSHNADGGKSVPVEFSTAIYTSSVTQHGGTLTLTKIDRSAPVVSFTATDVGVDRVTINARSSVNSSPWDYSTDNGGQWHQFTAAQGTSASYTITGLSPNTQYNLKVRARGVANQVIGTSGTVTVKTIGASVLNGVNTLSADIPDASAAFSYTVYNASYRHKLTMRVNASDIVTIDNITGSAGSNTKTFSLSQEQRENLLNLMPDAVSVSATYTLTTYDSGGSQIGNASSVTANCVTSAANSAPVFTDFTYGEGNSAVKRVTGNTNLFIRGYSNIKITPVPATAKNGAAIVKYRATAGKSTAEGASEVTITEPQDAGTFDLTVDAIDSRGYTSRVSKKITVLDYQPVKFTSWDADRVNNVEEAVNISVAGTVSALAGVDVPNALSSLGYRYKIAGTEYDSAYTDIDLSEVRISHGTFSYSAESALSLPVENSYYIEFRATDKFAETVMADAAGTIELYVNKGRPLVSFRSEKVGINKLNPDAALDVDGDTAISGELTLGGSPVKDYIVDYGTSGIWTYRKWQSGAAECWGCNTSTVQSTQGFGSVFINGGNGSDTVKVPYPEGLFKTVTDLQMTIQFDRGVGYALATSYNDPAQAAYFIIKQTYNDNDKNYPTSHTYIRATGTWK